LIVIIDQGVGMIIGLWILFSGRSRLRVTLRNFRVDLDTIWRILKIGIPGSVMLIQRIIANLVLVRLMAPFGTLAVAVHSLVLRIENTLDMPASGVASGANVLVGQNLGANQPGRAERSGWVATGFIEAFLVVSSLAILLWAESIVGIFNSEPELVKLASIFLRIAVAGYLVVGFVAVLQNALTGAGDTLTAMLFSVIMMWVVQLPLAFLLPRVTELGVYGVRWAIVIGIIVGAIAYAAYFRLGRWKCKEV
jgi:putative MATE family efflux protein